MCGIFGAIKLRGAFAPERFGRFVALTELVSYRGPDGCGYLALDSREGKPVERKHPSAPFDIFLGHRRLSIIDLSFAGKQPMTDGRGRWIIFNGEIFNFVELRAELKDLGCEFRTQTDTEVILQLYDKLGESGFAKMNGMWALAIVDLRSQRVVLSRDRFSIKPLYLLRQEDALYFASEIKQLLPLLDKKEPNVEVLSVFLGQALLDHSRETFFSGISKAPPKTNIIIDLRTAEVAEKEYWQYGRREPQSPESARDEFRALLIDSTRIRLRSDVKVGLLLSGGLDSSSLAVAALQAGSKDIETYSVVSDEKRFSEEPFIDAVNKKLGLKGVKFRFQLANVERTLLRVLRHSDEPFGSLSVVAQYGMFETIKENGDATVLLSGQGGDEVMLGYSKFFFFHLRDLVRRGRYHTAVGKVISSALRGTVVRQFRLSEAKRYISYFHRKKRPLVKQKCSLVPVWAAKGMRARQIDDIDSYSVPALTHYEDRNSMAHSLEVRHPFLDHRLVDLALSIPPEWQFRRGWTKSVLRETFAELPQEVRWRRDKQGFITPEERWLKHDLVELIDRTLKKSMLKEFGLLDSRAFLRENSSFRSGSPLVSYGDIFRVFITELWVQQHWGEYSASETAVPRQHAGDLGLKAVVPR